MKKTINKGAPSGFVVSLIFHAVIFFMAGLFVIFSVVTKTEPEFEPPPTIERPKMKLKKPKVKVRKTSNPKPSSRIVAKVKTKQMPEIQLPDLAGVGDGLLGGTGFEDGLLDIPEIEKITVFGSQNTIGNDFVGTLYDLKRSHSGGATGITQNSDILNILSRFTRGGWDLSVLNKYHQSETKLYTKHFMFPTMPSTVAPAAFDEPDMPGYAWVAYYRGKLVHPTGTRFRFWAQGDDIMIVRVNGEIVVDGSVADGPWADFRQALSDYQNSTARDGQYYLGHRKAEVGHWIDLEPGVPLDMEVLIGELPGGSFGAFLLVEEDGVEYANSPQNGPLLPIFKTDKLSHAELDAIYELLVEGEACPENGYGPIFSDYTTTVAKNDDEPQEEAFPSDMEENKPDKEEDHEVRTWTSADGSHTVVGHVVSSLDDSVFIETPEGKNIKLMLDQLSAADRTFLELAFPPQFKLTLLKSSKPRFIEVRSTRGANIPTILQWQFGARARQVGRKAYKHALTLEYYAVGQQVLDTDKYFLMDRAVSRFTPGPDNDYSHEFYGRRTAEVMKFTMYDQNMGRKFSGEYLVVLKDERGTIIGHNDTAKWLLENVDKLEKLPVGAFFDDTCTRIYPTSPPKWY